MSRWQVTVGPDSGAIHWGTAGILDHDIRRHVFIRSSQAMTDPGANRRTSRKLAAGGYMQRGRTMILVVGFNAMNESQVVNVMSQMREQFRNVLT